MRVLAAGEGVAGFAASCSRVGGGFESVDHLHIRCDRAHDGRDAGVWGKHHEL